MALEEASPTAIPGHLPRTGRETCLVQPFLRLIDEKILSLCCYLLIKQCRNVQAKRLSKVSQSDYAFVVWFAIDHHI